MIVTIVLGIIILVCIIAIIKILTSASLSTDSMDFIPIFVAFILACGGALILCLIDGGSIKKSSYDYFEEKSQIEYLLENNPSMYVVKLAEKYNNKVQDGNNYWCRFTIENRDEYLIDIDDYIKDNNQEVNVK